MTPGITLYTDQSAEVCPVTRVIPKGPASDSLHIDNLESINHTDNGTKYQEEMLVLLHTVLQ